jgi:osmotically-inducible protein OsmY
MAVLTGSVLLLLACGRSDPKLNERVQNRLADEGAPAGQVTVSNDARIVRLDGVVASPADRERLDRAARSVSGVLAVDNRLGIQGTVELTGATVDGGCPTAE